jgi:hypothetical protein
LVLIVRPYTCIFTPKDTIKNVLSSGYSLYIIGQRVSFAIFLVGRNSLWSKRFL